MYLLQAVLTAPDSVRSMAVSDTTRLIAPLAEWLKPSIVVPSVIATFVITIPLIVWCVRKALAWKETEAEEKQYLQWMEDQHRYLAITGLRTRQPVDVELEKVFVMLSVDPRSLAGGAESGEEFAEKILESDLLPDEPDARSFVQMRSDDDPASIGDALKLIDGKRATGMIVLGGPGSGKTTMMKWLALTYARNLQGDRLGGGEKRMPIYLALRDVARLDKPGPLHEVAANLNYEHECHLPASFYENRLSDGKCIVLFDGLDEVSDAKERKKVAAWVRERCDGLPNNPFVVTCRPAGFREEYLPPDSCDPKSVRLRMRMSNSSLQTGVSR